jgi:hypothetical protein
VIAVRLPELIARTPQLRATFVPGDPASGYYNDLTPHLRRFVPSLPVADRALEELTRDRRAANPVTIVQVGLGAWQAAREDERWLETVRAVVDWLRAVMADDGRIDYLFPMSHTYRLRPPWLSAMAQGEAASLLVRAAVSLEEPRLAALGERAIAPFIAPGSPLVASTPEGPVLQEYPTTPPAHVLNGWIFALWGLYDVACVAPDADRVEQLLQQSVDALAQRLPLYAFSRRWSRYDLYPHPIANVSSPFYHRLHIEQLRALFRLFQRPVFVETAELWEQGASRFGTRTSAVAVKVGFRLVRPRRREVADA